MKHISNFVVYSFTERISATRTMLPDPSLPDPGADRPNARTHAAGSRKRITHRTTPLETRALSSDQCAPGRDTIYPSASTTMNSTALLGAPVPINSPRRTICSPARDVSWGHRAHACPARLIGSRARSRSVVMEPPRNALSLFIGRHPIRVTALTVECERSG